jgi:hypothetical protein
MANEEEAAENEKQLKIAIEYRAPKRCFWIKFIEYGWSGLVFKFMQFFYRVVVLVRVYSIFLLLFVELAEIVQRRIRVT